MVRRLASCGGRSNHFGMRPDHAPAAPPKARSSRFPASHAQITVMESTDATGPWRWPAPLWQAQRDVGQPTNQGDGLGEDPDAANEHKPPEGMSGFGGASPSRGRNGRGRRRDYGTTGLQEHRITGLRGHGATRPRDEESASLDFTGLSASLPRRLQSQGRPSFPTLSFVRSPRSPTGRSARVRRSLTLPAADCHSSTTADH